MSAALVNQFFEAIRLGDHSQVQAILDSGCDPNIQHSEGYSALVFASSLSNVEILQVLLDVGAEVNSSKTPIYDYEREWSPLITAIVHNQVATAQKLIQSGADCNCYYNIDDRPDILLTEDIKSKLKDLNVSCTPLYVAVGFGNPELVQLLLDSGAEANDGDGNDTPLNLAVKQQDLEIVNKLLNAGADVNSEMEDEEYAVMTAASIGNLEIVKILAEAGADLDGWTQGESALSLAAQNGHQDVCEYLLPLVSEEHTEYVTQEMLEKGIKKRNRKTRGL